MSETFLNGRITLHPGDCLDVLATLEENSIDSVVTDPPYHLTSIVKRFGAENAAPAQSGKTGAYKRASAGFMGKQWDGGEIAFEPETWAAVMRVLKPGGHLLAFGAPKNFGFMQYAIAQAGFEVRDVLCWLFGSGFPKSHDVSKGIDRAAGAEREVVGSKTLTGMLADRETFGADDRTGGKGMGFRAGDIDITTPATDAAKQWAGYGTALKPAYEPIILARKPLIGTIASNVLKYGTGALNIDGCRVEHVTVADGNLALNPHLRDSIKGGNTEGRIFPKEDDARFGKTHGNGRWPANVLHDGSDEVVRAFPETSSGSNGIEIRGDQNRTAYGTFSGGERGRAYDANSGSAARFFYSAKADSDDRLGSKHPTVKPVDLIEYLEVLVTPPGGTILDPFAGTGTAGEAAFRRGFKAILIEREEEYCNDIRRRMALCMSGPDERARESIKARTKDKPVDHGPLFGAAMTAPPVEQSPLSREPLQ